MSKKPRRFLLLLVIICVPLLGGFSYWWLTTPSQTLTTFIEALEKGDTKTINALLENPYQFENSGDKLGFIGFTEKSPKRTLKIWRDALKKALKIKEREFNDYLKGRTQAELRVQSLIVINQTRVNKIIGLKKPLVPKTLNLTIIVNLNKITLKQKLEEPKKSVIYSQNRYSF